MELTDILLIVNLIISFLTPILMGIIQIFKHVRKSKCMGSESILSPGNSLNIENKEGSTKEDNIKAIEDMIKRLSTNTNQNKNIDV